MSESLTQFDVADIYDSQIDEEDIELIGAYAENRLGKKERLALMQRMAKEPKLYKVLTDLVVFSRGTEYEKILQDTYAKSTSMVLQGLLSRCELFFSTAYEYTLCILKSKFFPVALTACLIFAILYKVPHYSNYGKTHNDELIKSSQRTDNKEKSEKSGLPYDSNHKITDDDLPYYSKDVELKDTGGILDRLYGYSQQTDNKNKLQIFDKSFDNSKDQNFNIRSDYLNAIENKTDYFSKQIAVNKYIIAWEDNWAYSSVKLSDWDFNDVMLEIKDPARSVGSDGNDNESDGFEFSFLLKLAIALIVTCLLVGLYKLLKSKKLNNKKN